MKKIKNQAKLEKKDFNLTVADQNLDQKFENNINSLIAETIYIVNGLKPNNYLSLKDCKLIKDNGRVEAITSSITTQMYYDEEKQNYLFLSSSLIRDLATKHVLFDSNKRTALFTGKYILDRKIQIDFSMKKEAAIKFITNVVMNHENQMDPEKQLDYIQRKILNYSVKLEKTNEIESLEDEIRL